MSNSKRPCKPKEKTWVRARRDQTSLPQWLSQPLTPHEPIYNPASKVGALRWMLIWASARYPKTCFLVWLILALLAWVAFLILSLRQPGGALIPYALVELPLWLGLFWTLWPMLLYRLSGLPKPAARPSGRSAKQLSARNFYQGSALTLVFLAGNGGILWIWALVFLFARPDGASVSDTLVAAVFLLPLALAVGYPLFKGVWQVIGILRKRPSREIPTNHSDLVPDDAGTIGRKNRRRKTPGEQQDIQALEG